MEENIVYGRNAVYEVIKAGKRKVREILIAKSDKHSDIISKIIKIAREKKISIQNTDKHALDKITDFSLHQGISARVSEILFYSLDEILNSCEKSNKKPFFLVLNNINDPHNVGALLRSADACDVTAVITPSRNFPSINATVVKTSAGASEYVPIIKEHNIALCLEKLKKKNIWIFGADMDGAINYDEADFSLPSAIVLGSEGYGMQRLIKEKCDFLIKIPMLGKINSLNVSVSGALLMFEVCKKRREK